ncbi:hypothetical protein SBA4_4680007 [Candidatus Sulfopaludibacter sp. SbA4]|nr:hypothetical protein SBA4_4680007 [Candidatus Sulfopaludibacter sp. SbA4]
MQALAHPEVQVNQYSFAGSITLVFGNCRWMLKLHFISLAPVFRAFSPIPPAYTPGLRLFALPDQPAAAGAKEVARRLSTE